MHKFKAGDVVCRTAEVTQYLENKTGVRVGAFYTVSETHMPGSIRLKESRVPEFGFDSDKFVLILSADPADGPWSREQALRLRGAAEHAIAVYNEYIQKQPRLEPINIK